MKKLSGKLIFTFPEFKDKGKTGHLKNYTEKQVIQEMTRIIKNLLKPNETFLLIWEPDKKQRKRKKSKVGRK